MSELEPGDGDNTLTVKEVLDAFDNLSVTGRAQVAEDLCKRYSSVICYAIQHIKKCDCWENVKKYYEKGH